VAGAEDLMLPADWLLTGVISAGTVDVTTSREQASVARGAALLFPLAANWSPRASPRSARWSCGR
jgi:hypothetical protein